MGSALYGCPSGISIQLQCAALDYILMWMFNDSLSNTPGILIKVKHMHTSFLQQLLIPFINMHIPVQYLSYVQSYNYFCQLFLYDMDVWLTSNQVAQKHIRLYCFFLFPVLNFFS